MLLLRTTPRYSYLSTSLRSMSLSVAVSCCVDCCCFLEITLNCVLMVLRRIWFSFDQFAMPSIDLLGVVVDDVDEGAVRKDVVCILWMVCACWQILVHV